MALEPQGIISDFEVSELVNMQARLLAEIKAKQSSSTDTDDEDDDPDFPLACAVVVRTGDGFITAIGKYKLGAGPFEINFPICVILYWSGAQLQLRGVPVLAMGDETIPAHNVTDELIPASIRKMLKPVSILKPDVCEIHFANPNRPGVRRSIRLANERGFMLVSQRPI